MSDAVSQLKVGPKVSFKHTKIQSLPSEVWMASTVRISMPPNSFPHSFAHRANIGDTSISSSWLVPTLPCLDATGEVVEPLALISGLKEGGGYLSNTD